MKKRWLLWMLCPVLLTGFPRIARAGNEMEVKTGTVTIQYIDQTSREGGNKPIEGALFSFYAVDGEKEKSDAPPYLSAKTDPKGMLTADLPEGTYRVRQEKNDVAYRTSDFSLTIPMRNEQGVLTENVEAFPKAEPLTAAKNPIRAGSKKTAGQKSGPGPGKTAKTNRVKTGDGLLGVASAAAMISAAGLGTAMAVRKKQEEKGDDKA